MNERDVFLTVLEIDDATKRRLFLDSACGDDIDLRSRVEALLQSHQGAGSFLGTPAVAQLTPDAALESSSGDPDETRAEARTRLSSLSSLGEEVEGTGDGSFAFLSPAERPGSLGRLAHYEILELVGKGAMGIVFKALDDHLQRVVAVKVLAPELATNPVSRQRFIREARAAAAVAHENVVTIHAVEGQTIPPYLVMQFVAGISLHDKLAISGPLSVLEITRIACQSAAGLSAAHKQGLVHRDIKPANILLENGVERVKITDFGLARAVDDVQMTQSGMIAGTPQYMSPEQAQGEPIDGRSDLFSLGSVLYTMCTGRPAFRADSTVAVLRRVCDDTPRPIRQMNPEIPEWLEEIVDRLMAKRPDDRFQSAEEVAELLSEHLAELQQPTGRRVTRQTAAFPVSASPAQEPPVHARRWPLVAAAIVLLLLVVIFTESTGLTELFSGSGVSYPDGQSEPTTKEDVVPLIAVPETTQAVQPAPPVGLDEAALKTRLDAAKHKLQLVRDRNKAGYASTMEVFDAQLELSETEVALAELTRPWEEQNILYGQLAMFRFMRWRLMETLASSGKATQEEVDDAKAALTATEKRWADALHERGLPPPQPAYAVPSMPLLPVVQKDPGTLISFASQVGKVFYFDVTGSDDGNVWGTDEYTTDSTLAAACVHASLISPDERAVMKVTILPGRESYAGSSRNGKESEVRGPFPASFKVEHAPPNMAQSEPEVPPGATQGSTDGLRRLKLFHPSQEMPVPPAWADPNEAVKIEEGAWRIENNTDKGNFHVLMATLREDIPDDGIIVCRAKIKVQAHDKLAWGSLLLGDKGPDGHDYDWPKVFYTYQGNVPHWTIRETRYPAKSFHAADPPQIPIRVGLHANGVLWIKDLELLHQPGFTGKPPLAVAPFDPPLAKAYQDNWALSEDVPVEYENSLGMKFRLIPPGEYERGATPEEIAEDLAVAKGDAGWEAAVRSQGPRHRVHLSRAYYLGMHEVRQKDYEAVMGENPSYFSASGGGKDAVANLAYGMHPVESVSWDQATDFCNRLNRRERINGLGYRLPSEAEWEMACRAGTITRFWTGDDEADALATAWCLSNSAGRTHVVGESDRLNPFGLADMHGNVWEWMYDRWDETAYSLSTTRGMLVNPAVSSKDHPQRLCRGGSWTHPAGVCRSATRSPLPADAANNNVGFRVTLAVDAVRKKIAPDEQPQK